MSGTISTYVDDALEEQIETFAEYHDISTSKAMKILLVEGVRAREMRLRFEQMDAKLDALVESLAGEQIVAEAVKARFERVLDRGVAADLYDIKDEPHPFYQSASEIPDRSNEEAELLEKFLDERETLESDWRPVEIGSENLDGDT